MEWLLRYGVPRSKVRLCYLGAPDPYHGEDMRPPGEAILHVATDHSRKGTSFLLRSLKVLEERYGLKAKAWIVGERLPRYMEEAGALDVDADFLGRVSDDQLAELYQRAGLLALPSIDEGFGLPVVEAGFAARPTVATDAPCLPEVVRHGIDGLVTAREDVEAFAAALNDLLSDPARREKMGIRAREKALEFTIERVADRFLQHLLEAS
jgi:glycosyltransferase involved in cell wall biosynthesis